MTLLARMAGRLLAALTALVALGALLVGVPWGLGTFIGWPLPDHIPTSEEIATTLLNPVSVTLLLDILACIAWPTWLIFVVDVARCVPDVLRGVRPPAVGPVHAVAGVLVAATILGLPHPRTATASTGPLTDARPTVAVITAPIDTPATADSLGAAPPSVRTRTPAESGTVVVQPPRGGVHDSLWRIASRELGDGTRWRELFRLNEGRLQPDGHALTTPHLVRPGWVLRLPQDTSRRSAPPPQEQATSYPPQPAPPAPHKQVPDTAPDRHQSDAPEAVTTTSGTAITLWSGGLVAAALASTITLAMVIRRRRRMRTYEPGSGDRTPPPAPTPAVHALRLAHDEAQLEATNQDSDDGTEPGTIEDDHRLAPGVFHAEGEDGSAAVEIGVRDERARALDLAAVHGLGLTGAGAEATARSMLVHLLATTRATVVIPADDAYALLGTELPDSPRLRTTDDLHTAITDLVEWSKSTGGEREDTMLDVVLVATAERSHTRLQSVLDVGTAHGVAGILLGHWPPGATVRVRADGVVAAASPALDELRGSRLFHLDATDTRDLLSWFTETAPATNAPRPDITAESERVEEPETVADAEPGAEAEPVDEHHGGWAGPPATDSGHDLDSAPAGPDDYPHGTERSVQETEDAETETATERLSSSEASDVPTSSERSRERPERPWTLSIFGPVTLTWYGPDGDLHDLTALLAPKHKALLVFLALHPSGTTRESVREALWPDARGSRPYNAFYASLSQFRKAFSQATGDQIDLIEQHDERIALRPDLVEVDYWELHQAEHERHVAVTDEQRMTAWQRIAATYRGEIADGMSALWLDGPREAAHRTVVDALAGMAAHYRGHDPQRQLQLLEHARLLNPENEDIYRDIMRVQAQLGLTDGISRTVQLLTTTLADLGERPDPNTLTLARGLQARQYREAS